MEFERFLESRRGNYPHACLIVGGGDLREKAVALAAEMMGGAGRRKVLAGIHPDVTVLEGEGGIIKVDRVRALRADIFVRPNEGDRKIFIILGADTMNINAANALLKILEEPPSYGCFILTAANAAALPETVLSRCVKITARGEAGAEKGQDFSAHLAAVSDALCDKNELSLFTALYPLEAAGRDALRAFCAAGAEMMAVAVEISVGVSAPGQSNMHRSLAGKFSAERLSRMGRFLGDIASDIANVNPGILSGYICAGLWDEAFSNNPPTERNLDI